MTKRRPIRPASEVLQRQQQSAGVLLIATVIPGTTAATIFRLTANLKLPLSLALLHGAGFEPIDLVMGVSVYHVGYQITGITTAVRSCRVLTEAMYRARWNAMSRMQAEADSLGADGIVGVRLEWRHHGEAGEHVEFIAVGTAVRYTAKPGAYRRPNGQAFSSHLSGQDLVTLLRPVTPGRVRPRQLRLPRRRAGVHADPEAGRPQRRDAAVDPGQLSRRASWRCPGCRPRPSATARRSTPRQQRIAACTVRFRPAPRLTPFTRQPDQPDRTEIDDHRDSARVSTRGDPRRRHTADRRAAPQAGLLRCLSSPVRAPRRASPTRPMRRPAPRSAPASRH